MSDIIVDDPQRGLRESWSEGHLIQAIVLLEDAYSFRSIAHKLSPGTVLKLYRWYWSKWIQRLLTSIVSCQLLLIFVQYPSSLSRTSDLRQDRQRYTLPCSIQLIIEFLCLFIFYVDAIIRVRPFHYGEEGVDVFSLSLSAPGLFHWLDERSKEALDHILFHRHDHFSDRSDPFDQFRVSIQSEITPSSLRLCSLTWSLQTINIRYLLRPFYMAVISQEMKKIFNSLRKSFLQIVRYVSSIREEHTEWQEKILPDALQRDYSTRYPCLFLLGHWNDSISTRQSIRSAEKTLRKARECPFFRPKIRSVIELMKEPSISPIFPMPYSI